MENKAKLSALVWVQSPVDRMSSVRFPKLRSTLAWMKFVLVFSAFAFLAACANEPGADNPQNPAQTKADIKARDEFARNLPKPPEH